MRYSEIGKDVHGLIGGHTHWWGGEGGGAGRLKGEVAGALVCQRELEKAREIPLVCFHCMVALAKAPRWERRNIPFFSSSVALPQAEVFRELKGGCREVNGGLTLWFKQGTRPVSLKHVCRGRCYEHGWV